MGYGNFDDKTQVITSEEDLDGFEDYADTSSSSQGGGFGDFADGTVDSQDSGSTDFDDFDDFEENTSNGQSGSNSGFGGFDDFSESTTESEDGTEATEESTSDSDDFDESLLGDDEDYEAGLASGSDTTEGTASEDSDDEEATPEDTEEELTSNGDDFDPRTADPKLQAEYDRTFSGEEQIDQMLTGIEGKFTTVMKEIRVDHVILPKFKKTMRSKTVLGLTNLVSSLAGIVTPIHVMTMEDSEDEYILLDGTRRLFGALKSGEEFVNAVVWDFEDKEQGKALANVLSLVLNRSQNMKNIELWDSMRVLEAVNGCTPGKIEYLLQMQSGDAMKLRDVMLAERSPEIDEMREKFMADEMTIDAAYKKLNSIRKKEDRLARDEEREMDLDTVQPDMASGGAASGSGTGGGRHMGPQMPDAPREEKPRLSTDEAMKILEMDDDDEMTENSIAALKARGDAMRADAALDGDTDNPNSPHVQKVGERHPVDPEIRTAVFKRDNCKCRCCGLGGQLYMPVLVYHHIIPVFAGGPDTVENGLTLCANCHYTLHNYVDGKLDGDLADYTEEEQEVLKRVFGFGNKAIKAAKAMGLKRKQVAALDAESRKHIMPDKNVKDNYASYYSIERDKSNDSDSDSSDFDRGYEESSDLASEGGDAE